MEILDCAQNSPEWYQARMGIPTASEFAAVLAKGEGKTRKAYMLRLAGEILTGEGQDRYTNEHFERGHEMEPEARELYEFIADEPLQRVGFIRNGSVGCSPDSLVGKSGAVEIKTKLPHLMIEIILQNKFPAEFVAQCQGILWVAEREWIDLACYWPKLPLFVKRAYRDEIYIKNLAAEVERFNADLADVVERVRSYDLKRAA